MSGKQSGESLTDVRSMTCDAETAGYDGMFGVYCELLKGHDGPHADGHVEWDFVDPRWRNSAAPATDAPSSGGGS